MMLLCTCVRLLSTEWFHAPAHRSSLRQHQRGYASAEPRSSGRLHGQGEDNLPSAGQEGHCISLDHSQHTKHCNTFWSTLPVFVRRIQNPFGFIQSCLLSNAKENNPVLRSSSLFAPLCSHLSAPYVPPQNDITPLHVASKRGNSNMVKLERKSVV